MWRTTIKGLLAHKVRLALTALAVVLGVGFVVGTYVLTDTINKAFDNLFQDIDRGVAVQVQSVPTFRASGCRPRSWTRSGRSRACATPRAAWPGTRSSSARTARRSRRAARRRSA